MELRQARSAFVLLVALAFQHRIFGTFALVFFYLALLPRELSRLPDHSRAGGLRLPRARSARSLSKRGSLDPLPADPPAPHARHAAAAPSSAGCSRPRPSPEIAPAGSGGLSDDGDEDVFREANSGALDAADAAAAEASRATAAAAAAAEEEAPSQLPPAGKVAAAAASLAEAAAKVAAGRAAARGEVQPSPALSDALAVSRAAAAARSAAGSKAGSPEASGSASPVAAGPAAAALHLRPSKPVIIPRDWPPPSSRRCVLARSIMLRCPGQLHCAAAPVLLHI
jgi:hypothetical protein